MSKSIRTPNVLVSVVRCPKRSEGVFSIVLGRSDGNSNENYREAGHMRKDKDCLKERKLFSPPQMLKAATKVISTMLNRAVYQFLMTKSGFWG